MSDVIDKPSEEEMAEALRKYMEAMAVYGRADAPRKFAGRHLGPILCKALGLDAAAVRRLEIVVDVDDAATITVFGYVKISDADLESVTAELARYELRPLEE